MLFTVRLPVPVFDMERVRLAARYTVRLPNERFPVRPMMRLCAPEPLAAMADTPEVAVELIVMFPV